VSGMYWFCDGTSLRRCHLPNGASFYNAFSTYYGEGYGFYITRGDATRQAEAWLPLTFDHDDQNYSSYLTNAGSAHTLRCQWPRMLLPDIYQTHPVTTHQLYGGLKGDLAILLALIAFSMSRENLQQYLPSMFLNATWQVHGLPHGRMLIHMLAIATLTKVGLPKRGVVVWIYLCPSTPTRISTSTEIRSYEDGEYGLYYH
jgi:hypothetical protein